MSGPSINPNLSTELFLVSRRQKEKLNGHKSFVIWLTGLSGAGKSTIARHLELALFREGVHTLILDGDNTRMSINKDLDFSDGGRKENIRRVAEIAKLLNDAGVVVITAFISPFHADREMAKAIIGEDCFVEVFVNSSIEVCMSRDTKGLYQKALNGEINNFTGISSPYEIPKNPHLTLTTEGISPEESVAQVLKWLSRDLYLAIALYHSEEL